MRFCLEVAPVNELGHDEVTTILRSPHVVDWDYLGVVKAGKDASLIQKSVQVPRLRNPLGVRNFNRNWAVQFFVVSQKNLTKCPLAQTF